MIRALPLVSLLLGAGCHLVFGTNGSGAGTDALVDGSTGSACDPLDYDPARYGAITYSSIGFSWAQTREECQKRGMDLAVLDQGDTAELAMQSLGAPLPFWLGVSFATDWVTLDTCAPALTWAPGEPANAAPGRCIAMTGEGMVSEACVESFRSGVGLMGLCETPRPSPACRAMLAQRTHVLLPEPATKPEAVQACAAMGMHVLEINSSAELETVLQGVAAALPSFWLAAERADTGWGSPTTCPQVFTWKPGEPELSDVFLSCAVYEAGMRTEFCNIPVHHVICEANATP